MAKKGSFSKVYDKNGDYVDVEAARFDGTRTFQMQGDVSATQTWNGDSASALTLNTSIGAKKVTTDKINDKAVQTGQIDDGAVGLTQIATNAMNGTVQDNDSKLATHAAVKTYVDSQISGQGTYLGKHTVAEINAMVTDNLHNGDRVMTSDSGTINLGPGGVGFDVEAGEDLILYKSGSTVQWDSMDGNFKTKQTAVSDPTASGTGLTFIDSASQDENGEMTLSKKTVQDGTTSQKGVVQLEDSHTSTSTTKAATPNSVKEAYDLASTAKSGLANKQDKPSSATENNIATFNGSKSTKDSGKSFLPSTSTWDGTSDDKVPTAKAVQAQLDAKANANSFVSIADSKITRGNQSGDGWYKVAELSYDSLPTTIAGLWRLCCLQSNSSVGEALLNLTARIESTTSITTRTCSIFSDSISESNFGAKAVYREVTASSINVELWVYVKYTWSGVSISELNGGGSQLASEKKWTYTSYTNNGGGSEPVSDTTNHVSVEPFKYETRQHKVANATNGNFAGLNTYGMLTDSGKKAADFELVANKVTSVRAASSATDTAYPSEKAVATALDAKADADKVLSVCDAYVSRGNVTTMGWYKLAERQFNTATTNNNSIFDIYSSTIGDKYFGTLKICLRNEGYGTEPYIKSVALYSESGWNNTYFPLKLVTRGLVGSLKLEIWVGISTSYRGVWLTEVNTTSTNGAAEKRWTYFSYTTTAGGEEPVDDATNDVKTTAIPVYVDQHNIASPTNNNLVAMDANGLVKDSGKKASDFATSAQGSKADSAVQDVTVDGASVVNSSTKVAAVPNASTSAKGVVVYMTSAETSNLWDVAWSTATAV